MVIYQLVKRVELYDPKEVLPSTITEHFEVLYTTTKPEHTNSSKTAAKHNAVETDLKSARASYWPTMYRAKGVVIQHRSKDNQDVKQEVHVHQHQLTLLKGRSLPACFHSL